MISANSIKVMAKKSTDMFSYSYDIRYTDVQSAYLYLMASGYSVYDVVAESGFANLAGKTPGKWICLWVGAPSASYTLASSYFTPHTDVIVLGIQIDANQNIVDYYFQVNFNLGTSQNYAGKLTFHYFGGTGGVGSYFTATTAVTGISILHSKIWLGSGVPYNYLKLYYCMIQAENAVVLLQDDSGTIQIENCYFYFYAAEATGTHVHKVSIKNQTTASSTITIKNTVWNFGQRDDAYWRYQIELHGSAGVANVINFENCSIIYPNEFGVVSGLITQTNNLKIDSNGEPPLITGDVKSNYAFNKVSFESVGVEAGNDIYSYFSGIKAFSFDFSTCVDLTCKVEPERVLDTRILARGTKNYYNVSFVNACVPDTLKHFGDGWVWVVKREDYDYDLVTAQKYIKNLSLYSDDVCTELYDLDSDENFLIYAQDASLNKAVFLWFGNKLWRTKLSDAQDNVVYTILNCFQIWAQEEFKGVKALFRDKTTKKQIANGPLTGSVRFNNCDNEAWV